MVFFPLKTRFMSWLIFLGLIVATAVLALSTINNIKEMLQPETAPVRQ